MRGIAGRGVRGGVGGGVLITTLVGHIVKLPVSRKDAVRCEWSVYGVVRLV